VDWSWESVTEKFAKEMCFKLSRDVVTADGLAADIFIGVTNVYSEHYQDPGRRHSSATYGCPQAAPQ